MAMHYDKAYSLRTYEDTYRKAEQVFKSNNLNMSKAINLFLKNVAVTGEVVLLNEEQLEKEILFQQLQGEVKQAIDDYEAGVNTLSADEVRKRLGL